MSLTNPNTPVSQQDLQDFYHKLLPYMGGSFGMIANKFSKGDMYSTDEKMIGQWIDGKPLYQKVYTYSSTQTFSARQWANSNIPKSGIKNIVNCFLIDNTGFVYCVCAGISSSSEYVKLLNPTYDNSYTADAIVIQYTKTTDSAISIGDDTDYSTEEKIVGTWIDGTPIYQKTFTGLSVTPAYNNWTTVVSVSDLSVDKIMGVCIYNTTQSMMAGIQYNAIEFRVFDGSLDAEYLQNVARREINIVTLQYTKTTD